MLSSCLFRVGSSLHGCTEGHVENKPTPKISFIPVVIYILCFTNKVDSKGGLPLAFCREPQVTKKICFILPVNMVAQVPGLTEVRRSVAYEGYLWGKNR